MPVVGGGTPWWDRKGGRHPPTRGGLFVRVLGGPGHAPGWGFDSPHRLPNLIGSRGEANSSALGRQGAMGCPHVVGLGMVGHLSFRGEQALSCAQSGMQLVGRH